MEEKVIVLGSLIEARNVINEYVDLDIDARVSYKLMKILDITEKDNQFYFDKFKSVIEKYGERDDNGDIAVDDQGNIKIVQDAIADTQREINDIASIEVSIPCRYLLSLDDLNGFKMSCRKMKIIEPFLKDE